MWKFIHVLTTLFVTFGSSNADIISLNENWLIESSDGIYSFEQNTIPSGIYSTFEKWKLPSVLHSFNDVHLRNISYINWTYSNDFKIALADITPRKHVILTFHGIDTIATITLNGIELGTVDNMFVRYRFDVKNILRKGFNHLEVEIASPMEAAKHKASNYISTPPDCPPEKNRGECHINFLRKMQMSFGWDFAPAVLSMGIWKPVFLELYDAIFIRDVTYRASRIDTGTWTINVTCYMEAGVDENENVRGVLRGEIMELNAKVTKFMNCNSMANGEVIQHLTLTVNQPEIELWWPNGYGKQKMYHMMIIYDSQIPNNSTNSYRHAKKVIRMAFRSVELIQEPIPNQIGLTFYFRINNINIFMKGSNWVPSSIYPERSMNATRVKHLLIAAKQSHMNMLRVWGGGIYEHDEFYEMADNYGILIWQDLMFASAMYPVYSEFLQSVETEIEQNIRRLQKHPSLAILAGNNEIESALAQNWFGTDSDYDRYTNDYHELFIKIVKPIIERIDPAQSYVSSSPSNGKFLEMENCCSQDPQNASYGDIHFFNYNIDGWDAKQYPHPRFVSEFGYESYPTLKSCEEAAARDDNIFELLKHRHHSKHGEISIEFLLSRHLILPNKTDSQYFDALIYFSQLSQAMVVKTQAEIYRTRRIKNGGTMGALFWQLNDVWIAPTWSSIDYYGRYKILQYWAQNFFAPIHVAGCVNSNDIINIYVIRDDLTEAIRSYTVDILLFKWSSLQIVHTETIEVDVKSNSVVKFDEVLLDQLYSNGINITKSNSFIELRLRDSTNKVISTNHIFTEKLRDCEGIVDPALDITIEKQYHHMNKTYITLRSNVQFPAVFVYLQFNIPPTVHHKFSSNGYIQTVPVRTIHLEFDNMNNCMQFNVTISNIIAMTVNQFMIKQQVNTI